MMGSGEFPMLSGEKSTEIKPSSGNLTSSCGDLRQLPSSDPSIPLSNLSVLGRKMNSLSRFLSQSVECHVNLTGDQLQMVSNEIAAAVQQIIVNGAALLASSQTDPSAVISAAQITGRLPDPFRLANAPASMVDPKAPVSRLDLKAPVNRPDLKAHVSRPDLSEIAGKALDPAALDVRMDDPDRTMVAAKSASPGEDLDLRPLPESKDRPAGDESDCEVVELDAVELLAEHVHFCEICGKGFKRDANLRMHMRAHGNRFKTLEALSRPEHISTDALPSLASGRKTRFSCPAVGCNRNRSHKRFRPLKSAICVKNHFKRSHCPKMYSCNRCNKKSFSVLADLKSHLKHCGECRWRCSCGTSFSRKDKLFGHMALFEGHMPVFVAEDEAEEKKEVVVLEEEEEEEEERGNTEVVANGGVDSDFFDGYMMGFEGGDNWSLDAIF